MDERHHLRNVTLLWVVASVIVTPIIVFVVGPGLPPGNGSVEASGQVTDNTVLLAMATPVALGVLVYLGYALWAFRERTPDVVVDGPPIRGNSSLQFWWLVVTTTLVLVLAGYGTARLLAAVDRSAAAVAQRLAANGQNPVGGNGIQLWFLGRGLGRGGRASGETGPARQF